MNDIIKKLVVALLPWYSQSARDLPWRREPHSKDPYCIYVSEIMLQQTQVKTVIPYWERWMRALPTIESLAAARPDVIHKLWEGLGYYTRVRNMQKAAQEIVAHHQGRFPRDFESILALPGIGRYTAGAISSIAFNEPRPILDGNVIRVLTRLFGIAENPREKSANQKLWHLAEELVTAGSQPEIRREYPESCSHLNQSLMELGALICTPKQPRCLLCPVQSNCTAHRSKRVGQLPNLGPRLPTTSRHFAAFVIKNRGRFLVRQRPAGVVNAHLWEFPNVETTANNSTLDQLAKKHLGLNITTLERFCDIKHTITRYRITLEVYHAKAQLPKLPPAAGWATSNEMASLAFTSAHGKILKRLRE